MTTVTHLRDTTPRTRYDTPPTARYGEHIDALTMLFRHTAATDREGREISVDEALAWVIREVGEVLDRGGKVMVIGNGGSAAIASHLANDFTRSGGVPGMVFNDGAGLTCMGNDLGFEQVFAEPIRLHGRGGDLLVAISSSGSSANILNGVAQARERGCSVVTFSGFARDNPLRASGDMNLFVPSSHYGQVEVTHQMLCHALIDFGGRWG